LTTLHTCSALPPPPTLAGYSRRTLLSGENPLRDSMVPNDFLPDAEASLAPVEIGKFEKNPRRLASGGEELS